MLVIFSDLHISDETTSLNVNPDAFKNHLFDTIKSNASKLNVEEIRIILLGDIFDLVRTDYWLKLPKIERPWNGNLNKRTAMNNNNALLETHYGNVLDKILNTKTSKALIGILNKLRKDFSAINFSVKISYVIGNHDRAINNFDSLKNKIKEKLDDFKESEIEFVNMFMDKEYSVLCRHGHEFDETNYGWLLYKYLNNKSDYEVQQFDHVCYNMQTMGEVITCELMSGIIYRLADQNFTETLKNLNNVRPMSDAFLWLYWYGNAISKTNKRLLLKAFKESLKAVLDTELAREWDNIHKEFILFNMDITDVIEKISNLIDDLDFDSISKYVETFKFFDKIFGTSKDDYVEGAKNDFKNQYFIKQGIQYILYGHTHEARTNYFNGTVDGKVSLYINTGTYLPFIQKSENGNSFVSADQLTMAFIFKKNESENPTKNPSLILWNGIKK